MYKASSGCNVNTLRLTPRYPLTCTPEKLWSSWKWYIVGDFNGFFYLWACIRPNDKC